MFPFGKHAGKMTKQDGPNEREREREREREIGWGFRICERPRAVAGKTKELGTALGPKFPVDFSNNTINPNSLFSKLFGKWAKFP